MACLTGHNRKEENAMQIIKVHNAENPEPAFTREMFSASKVQPMTSFPTPADRTTIPRVVSSNLSSVRMRQRTGKAVIEYATPVKSMK